jgi:hypothetical protein
VNPAVVGADKGRIGSVVDPGEDSVSVAVPGKVTDLRHELVGVATVPVQAPFSVGVTAAVAEVPSPAFQASTWKVVLPAALST